MRRHVGTKVGRGIVPAAVAVTILATTQLVASPAYADTVTVTLDCQGPVSVTANPGDRVVLTLGSGCPIETGGAPPGHFGGYVFSFPVIGFGWLLLDSWVNTGPNTNTGSADFWDVRSDGSGTTSATTTLLDANPSPLVAGVSVIGYSGINGLSQYDIIWAGPAAPVDNGAALDGKVAGPPDWLQQVGVPAGGSCADVDDADDARFSTIKGGWAGPVWGEWINDRAGGLVCERTLRLNTASGSWMVVH